MKKTNKNQIVCFLIMLFCFTFFSKNVYAIQGVNLDIYYKDKQTGEAIYGAVFSAYKIGQIGADNKLIMEDRFKDYPFDLGNIGEEGRNDYAETLKSYVLRDGIFADAKGITGGTGHQKLTLNEGVYLIVGENVVADRYVYKTSPFIISLPQFDSRRGIYLYDVVANPKSTKEAFTPNGIEISVQKVWEDKGFEDERPKFIEIELLDDGKVKETVKLNTENNWQYRWENLNQNSMWSVVEKNIDKNVYSVKIREEKNGYVITNSYIPIHEVPDDPREKIPQTGQLWWPVYLLSSIGVLSITIGYAKEVKKSGIDEKGNL